MIYFRERRRVGVREAGQRFRYIPFLQHSISLIPFGAHQFSLYPKPPFSLIPRLLDLDYQLQSLYMTLLIKAERLEKSILI